jgi:hypothetical protein
VDYFNVVVNSAHTQFPNVQSIYLIDEANTPRVLNMDFQVFDSVSSVLKQPNLTSGKGIIMLTGCGAYGIDSINELALILKTIHGL